LSASSCWAFSNALVVLWSESETSFESSVWRSVSVVDDLSKVLRKKGGE
jgi:hypothetical protein